MAPSDRIWTLLAGALLWISLSVAACGGTCPPIQHDDVFPLDLQRDAGVSSGPPDGAVDAATTSDGAATNSGVPDASRPPDANVPPDASAPPPRQDCGSLAEGCTPGQPCPPACDCVLARQRMSMDPMAVIDQCTLFAGAGPPSVEVRSHVRVGCE